MVKLKRLIAYTIVMVMLALQLPIGATTLNSQADTRITASESRGLRVQLYASTWGLSGKWFNTDLLGVARTNASKYDLSEAAKALGLNREDIKRVRLDGFIKPDFSERYSFTTNHNNDLKLWVNDKLVINYGLKNDIELSASQVYKIELEMQNRGYNEIKIYWKSTSQSNSLIPSKRTLAPETSYEIPRRELSQIDYNPNSDTDGDGIPDAWERNGYTVQEGIIMPYEASLHQVKYVTDERNKSTDGDPYTDFEEVTGINMDQSVKAPGNHPLVPAYPSIEFVPTSVKIVPSVQNADVKSVKIGSGLSEKVSAVNLDTNSTGGFKKGTFESKLEIGSKYEANSVRGEGYVGAFYKLDNSGGITWNSRNSVANEVKDIESNTIKESSSVSEGENVTVNTTNYAYLEVNGYYRNNGTATAYTVDPTMTLSIAGEEFVEELVGVDTDTIVKSFKVVEGQKPHLIGPEVNYPANGNINLSLTTTTEGYLPTPIRLTKSQVDKLELGYPFKLKGSYVSFINNESTLESNRWSSYEHAINEVSATVTLALPKVTPIVRKIYAGKASNRVNLLEALTILFKGSLNERGNLVIDGEEITPSLSSEWGIKVIGSRDAIDRITQEMNKGNFGYDDFLLEPGLKVEVYKKDSAAKANIINAYYNPNDSRIYATVIPGAEALESVVAKVKTGEERTLTLTASENDKYSFVSEPVVEIRPEYNNHIIAGSEGGQQAIARIIINSDYLKSNAKRGLNFEPYPLDPKPLSVGWNKKQQAVNYVKNNPQNKYYAVMIGENYRRSLVKRQLNHSVEFGNTTVYNQAESEKAVSIGQFKNPIPANRISMGAYTYYTGRYLRERRIYGYNNDSKMRGQLHYQDVPVGEFYDYISINNYGLSKDKILKMKLAVTSGDRGKEIGPRFDHYVYNTYKAYDYYSQYARLREGGYGLTKAAKFKHLGARVYNVTPAAEHTQFAIIPRQDLLEYLVIDDGFWNSNGLAIIGMFTEDNSGQVFIPRVNNYVTVSGGTSEIAIGTNVQPDAVMMNVKKVSGDPGVVTVGNHVMGLNTGNEEDQHQDLVIVDAKDNGKVNVSIPDGKSVDTQVLGYFIDKSKLTDNQKYLQYWVPGNPIKKTIMPQFNDAEARMSLVLSGNEVKVKGYPVKPKGYIIKVDQLDVGTKKFDLTINGQSIKMDVGHKIGSIYNSINHTGYAFITANTDNAHLIDMVLNIDTQEAEGNQGEVQIEVIGFFYENLY